MEEPESYDCFTGRTHRGKVAYAYVVGGKLRGFLCEGCGEDTHLNPRPIPIDEYLAGIREEDPRRCCVSDPGNHGGQIEGVGKLVYCTKHNPARRSVDQVFDLLTDCNGDPLLTNVISLESVREVKAAVS